MLPSNNNRFEYVAQAVSMDDELLQQTLQGLEEDAGDCRPVTLFLLVLNLSLDVLLCA